MDGYDKLAMVKGISGAIAGLNKANDKQKKLEMAKATLEMDKQKNKAYLSKAKADLEAAKYDMSIKPTMLKMQQEELDLKRRDMKVKEDTAALALATAGEATVAEKNAATSNFFKAKKIAEEAGYPGRNTRAKKDAYTDELMRKGASYAGRGSSSIATQNVDKIAQMRNKFNV